VVRHERWTLDRARLLEQAAALGGALRGLGVRPGQPVGALLDDPLDDLLLLLACARLGAAYLVLPDGSPDTAVDAHEPRVVATSRPLEFAGHVPAACLVRGFPPADGSRDVDWDVAMRAGGTDPAACADLPPDLPAIVVDGATVPVGDVVTHGSTPARRLATLVAGDAVSL
jgi:propionyl-CoA synthetase